MLVVQSVPAATDCNEERLSCGTDKRRACETRHRHWRTVIRAPSGSWSLSHTLRSATGYRSSAPRAMGLKNSASNQTLGIVSW